MNAIKTGILLLAIGFLAVWAGSYFFGQNGAVIGIVVALVFQVGSLFFGHKMALKFARARPLTPGSLPWYEQAAEELSRKAGIPTPALYVSPDPQPNAFAAGWSPKVAVVSVNVGLLDHMPQDQVIAVLAHEIAHIRNRDMLTMTVAAGVGSFLNFLAYAGFLIPRGEDSDRNPFVDLLVMLIAPITATIIQLAISRTREFGADAYAAQLLGTPAPMIGALQTLGRTTSMIPSPTAQAQTAHMYISAPFQGAGCLTSLFSTHPRLEDRIAALQGRS